MKSSLLLLLLSAVILLFSSNTLNSPITTWNATETIGSYLNGIFPSVTPCRGTQNSISNCTEDEPPQLLSQTGAFQDLETLTPVSGLLPYDLIQPLWTDGASKKRWIALASDGFRDSPSEQIIFSATGSWSFPAGTVLIKHFEMPIDKRNLELVKKLETRFLVFTEDSKVYGVTYKWNEAGTDAELLEHGTTASFQITQTDGSTDMQVYDFPGRLQCLNCHNANAGRALGLKTWQLNKDYVYSSEVTDNQLSRWRALGMFGNPFETNEVNGFLKAAHIEDESASLALRVRSYLDSNCSHCHAPNSGNGAFDARFPIEMSNKNLIYGYQIEEIQYVPQGYIIKPQDPEQSELWVRDNSVGTPIKSMPPIAKNVIDEKYISVLTDYINSLEIDCLEEGCNCSDGIQNGNETDIDCGGSDCVPCESQQTNCEFPLGLWVSNNTGKQVTLEWTSTFPAKDYMVQGRPIGNLKWRSATVKNPRITASVRPNLDYEWRVRSNCEEERSEWSEMAFFSTHSSNTNVINNKSIAFDLSGFGSNVYPNPSQHSITITSDEPFVSIDLFNLQGRLVKRIAHQEASYQLQLSIMDLEKGSYFIRLQTENEIKTMRFVKD